MTKEEAVKEYFANIGRKGGSVSGPQKARNMGREHYEKVSRGQRERWRKWREQRANSGREQKANSKE